MCRKLTYCIENYHFAHKINILHRKLTYCTENYEVAVFDGNSQKIFPFALGDCSKINQMIAKYLAHIKTQKSRGANFRDATEMVYSKYVLIFIMSCTGEMFFLFWGNTQNLYFVCIKKGFMEFLCIICV